MVSIDFPFYADTCRCGSEMPPGHIKQQIKPSSYFARGFRLFGGKN